MKYTARGIRKVNHKLNGMYCLICNNALCGKQRSACCDKHRKEVERCRREWRKRKGLPLAVTLAELRKIHPLPAPEPITR